MVGDRISTDIKMAANAGIDSVLVLTGCDGVKDMHESDIKPTYTMERLGNFRT